MAWDLFSLELDLGNNNEVNVVQPAKVEPVPTPNLTKNSTQKKKPVLFEVDASSTNEVLNDLMPPVGATHQEKVQAAEGVANIDLKADLGAIATFEEELVEASGTDHTEACNAGEVVSYEVGDVVKIIFPTEEEDSEMYNYLHYYYSHLKGKKGRVLKVLPYKKLQYQVEFDIKNEDRFVTLYHENLLVFSY